MYLPPHGNFFVSAATSLISATYSILRSLTALSLLYGFCFGALKVRKKTESEHVLEVIWSFFIYLLPFPQNRTELVLVVILLVEPTVKSM